MQVIQKTKITIFAAIVAMGVLAYTLAITTPASALNDNCGVQTSIIDCGNVDINESGEIENTGLWSLLLTAINLLTAGIGIAAVAGIVYGSVLYTSAADNPEQVKKAIEIIRNVVIGLVAYALMYSALNFLIPGGLFT